MNSTLKCALTAVAIAALGTIAACKSDSSYREHEQSAGEEVEAQDEHGDTGIDDADEANEYESERK